MAGVTISLSSLKPYHVHHHNERLIGIRPIKSINIEETYESRPISFEDEKETLEKEILILRENLTNLKQEKENMLQSTKEEIKLAKEQWEQEKQLLAKQGYQEGYQLGVAEGKMAAEKQYEQLINEMNELEKTAIEDYHKKLEQSDHHIVDLSVKIAEKIMKEELATDPNLFLNIVIAAITEIKDQSQISIYVHPNNYQSLLKQKGELMNALDGDTKLSIFINQKITENGCLIEHPFGQIDASIDTQLQQIREILHQVTMEKKS